MKNIYFILIITMILTSCSKDFIELTPISDANVENFYLTDEDFNSATVAAYSNLQEYGQYGSLTSLNGSTFYALTDVRSSDISDGDAGAGTGVHVYRIDAFVDDAESPIIEATWVSLYNQIFKCNTLLNRIELVETDIELAKQYKGEARFLRGMAYFNLVRMWGGVPLILEELESPDASRRFIRTQVEEVYTQILDDLQFASQNLPETYSDNDLGRATSWAAKALLGKVYLTRQDWGMAVSTLEDVVNNSGHALLADVQSLFDTGNEINEEVLFAARFVSGGEVGKDAHVGFGTPNVSNLTSLYTSNDKRLPLLDIEMSGSAEYVKKHFDAAENQGRDFIILRFADALLMHAEALNEQGFQSSGTSFDALNAVRTRAGIDAYSSSELDNQSDFRNAVWQERRLELAVERHRWFDLLRTGEAKNDLQTVGQTIQDYQLLYPIPQREINAFNDPSGFPQNTGY